MKCGGGYGLGAIDLVKWRALVVFLTDRVDHALVGDLVQSVW